MGDKTSTGASCIGSLPNCTEAGRMVVRVGDKTTPCQQCGKPGIILDGEPSVTFHGVAAAVDRSNVMCGCPPGTHFIIAPAGEWLGSEPSPEPIPREKSTAMLAARKAGQESEHNRVFAKSCLRGDGCNDAGDGREPHSYFSDMAFFQAMPASDFATDTAQHAQADALWRGGNGDHEEMDYQAAVVAAAAASRVQTATAGASVLELIGGRALTYGTWAVRGAAGFGEIAAAGAGAPVAGLLVGMMPGRLNDGEQDFIDRMRLEQMREAPSRVRYTWEQNSKGSPVPHGWHTPSGKDRVRVRKMAWDNRYQAYTFTTEEEPHITIIWTPDHSGVNTPSNTGNPTRPELPNPVIVDPLPENTGITATTSPAPEEKSFADYILILPLPDLPPIYIYLSKRLEDPIWTKRKKITEVKNAYNHWLKHGSEFPELANSKEYVDATHDFVHTPPAGTLIKTRENGDTLLYHPESNTLGVKSKDGTPRTMFKPTDAMDYWKDQ